MGLFRALGGLFEAGVSAVLTPVAIVSDTLEGDGTNTEECVKNIGSGVKKTLQGTITTVSDPFDEDDDW